MLRMDAGQTGKRIMFGVVNLQDEAKRIAAEFAERCVFPANFTCQTTGPYGKAVFHSEGGDCRSIGAKQASADTPALTDFGIDRDIVRR